MIKSVFFIVILAVVVNCDKPIEDGVYIISSKVDGTVITYTHRRNEGQHPYYTEAVEMRMYSSEFAKDQHWNFRSYSEPDANQYRVHTGENLNESSDMKYTLFYPNGYMIYETWTLISNENNDFVMEGMSIEGPHQRCLQYNGAGQNATRTICNGERNQLWNLKPV